MKKILIMTTALSLSAGAALAQGGGSINITTYGGAFGEALPEAYLRPFTEATGIGAQMIDNADPRPS